MGTDTVWAAYGARAAEYTDLLGHLAATAEKDRRLIGDWAAALDGPVLDAGCGPGHWTAYLDSLGCDVLGVDPVPEFLARARERHPGSQFVKDSIETYADEHAGRYAGVLAWYSLIHHEPTALPRAISALRTLLSPGGGLLVGFFDGPELAAFDHAVTTAYFWPLDTMSDLLVDAGFELVQVERRVDPGARPHAAIVATRAT